MRRVRISELKSHLSEHLRAAEAGETIEVMDRARAIARVVAIVREDGADIVPAERTFASVRNVRLAPAKLSIGSLEVLQQERGER